MDRIREKRACPARERGERLRVAPNYFSLSSMHAHLKCESIFCDAGEEILIASRQHFIMTRVCVQSQSLFASDAPRAARHVRPRALTWSELGENALDLCMRIHSIRTSTGALRFNGGIARGALWRWRAQWVVKKGWSFKSRFAPWVYMLLFKQLSRPFRNLISMIKFWLIQNSNQSMCPLFTKSVWR